MLFFSISTKHQLKKLMKHVYNFTAGLLGFIFIVFGVNFFLKFIAIPQPPEGSPAAMFLGGMLLGGLLAFVKVLEILGGILVAIPRTRNLGLLILGPIIVNIAAFNFFFFGPLALLQPPVLLVSALALIQVVAARRAFSHFITTKN
ncbi:MAG: hypothetical protein EBY32_16390 [Proteobacteria bacterium]|nr:hypothetical protein [Pseudomonadota bacterium]